jgi:acyl carrier protein
MKGRRKDGTAFEALTKIVEEHLGTIGKDEQLTRDTLFEDLGADSLDIVDLTLDVEVEFDTTVPDNEIEAFKKIGDVMDWLEKNADLSGYISEKRLV